MSRRIRVAVLCGGRSAEHEVSLQSARNVVGALDRRKYDVVLIGIDRQGRWRLHDAESFLAHARDPGRIRLGRAGRRVALGAGCNRFFGLADGKALRPVDVVFPVLHGPFGEDGTVQGLLELSGLPFVGAGVLGSAVGMDKEVMKRLLREAGVPVADFEVLHWHSAGRADLGAVIARLGLPLFVKPANLGSSVGIRKVKSRRELKEALHTAFAYDGKVLVESFVAGREIECSVLGNEDPVASLPGEVVPRAEFYSYRAKYLEENGALLIAPADLPDSVVKKVRQLAVDSFRACCCEGMARVDFFLTPRGRVVVNELNTIPGFTSISMYPRLWQASGIPYPQLIDRLIRLALDRRRRQSRLRTSCENEMSPAPKRVSSRAKREISSGIHKTESSRPARGRKRP
jgi:D-alanine-D-alanine ligase